MEIKRVETWFDILYDRISVIIIIIIIIIIIVVAVVVYNQPGKETGSPSALEGEQGGFNPWKRIKCIIC